MPKAKREAPPRASEILAPAQLINIAAQRPLRPGEHQALMEAFVDLDMKLRALRESNDRLRSSHEDAIASQDPHVRLEGNALLIKFPEQHYITLQLGETPDQKRIAVEALFRILSQRHTGERRSIGTAAAPVQYDVQAILRAIRADQISRVEPKRKVAASPDLSLADLDIDLS